MLDISSLERRWYKYKIKQFTPYIALVILAMIIPIIIINLNTIHNTVPQQITKKSHPKKVQTIVPIQESQMVLEPSMQFVQSFSQPTAINNLPPASTIKIDTKAGIQQKSAPSLSAPSSQVKQISAPPPVLSPVMKTSPNTKTSSINRDTEVFDIHEIEERFKSNSNPHLGLYIARYHYDHANYTEAYNYALKTNAINNTVEESWLIFAKSLVKLGKTDQAKKTLQQYISHSNSDNARNLLDSLEKGDGK